MYEELIQRLRETSMDFGEADHVSVMLLEAADAIEKLQKKYDGAVSDNKSLCRQIAELAKERNEAYSKGLLEGGIAQRAEDEKWLPRWIPVTERLPEESEGLNWGEEPTLRFTSVWCCDVNTGTIEVRNRLQGKKTGIDGLDQYMKDTDWHWSQSWWEPTHWMPIVPLPEPPKEAE